MTRIMWNLTHLLKLALVLILTVLTADSIAQNKEQIFTEAVVMKDTTKVKALLAEGVNPDLKTKMGMYPLMIAVNNDDLVMVRILLKAGANPNVKPTNAGPILHCAKNAPMLKLLLDANANMYYLFPTETHFESFAQRLLTTEAQKKKAIDMLKKLKASNQMNEQMYKTAVRSTEIEWQTMQNMIDVVNIYMEKGYDPSKLMGKHKQNVIYKAVVVDNYEILHILMKTGKVDFRIRPEGAQPAICQITVSNPTGRKITEYETLLVEMLKNGSNIEDMGETDMEEATSLMLASLNGILDRCQVLVKLGADVNKRNSNSRNALFFAKKLNVVKFLFDKGADINVTDKWNQSVMFYKEEPDVINFYLSKKLNPNHVNTKGETPIFACRNLPAVIALCGGGADINHLTPDGRSIFDMDIEQIIEASKFDKDIQHLFIPKMKYLIEKGIKQEIVEKAYKACSGKTDFDRLGKIKVFLEKYLK